MGKSALESYQLVCHPETPSAAVEAILASVKPGEGAADWLQLSFELHGQLDMIKFTEQGPAIRSHNLWQHTCFEMFSRNRSCEAYEELNFSPSTCWAAYDFKSYRKLDGDIRHALFPNISVQRTNRTFRLSAQAALAEGAGPWLVGLSAVIEEIDGTKSYWALAHPPGKPDFHHPTCFAAMLPAPEQS